MNSIFFIISEFSKESEKRRRKIDSDVPVYVADGINVFRQKRNFNVKTSRTPDQYLRTRQRRRGFLKHFYYKKNDKLAMIARFEVSR
jgi:hypothetical protein